MGWGVRSAGGGGRKEEMKGPRGGEGLIGEALASKNII